MSSVKRWRTHISRLHCFLECLHNFILICYLAYVLRSTAAGSQSTLARLYLSAYLDGSRLCLLFVHPGLRRQCHEPSLKSWIKLLWPSSRSYTSAHRSCPAMLDQWRRFTSLEEANDSAITECASPTRASKNTCTRCVTIRQALTSSSTSACACECKKTQRACRAQDYSGRSFEAWSDAQ